MSSDAAYSLPRDRPRAGGALVVVLAVIAGCNAEQQPTGPSIAPALACQGYAPEASSPNVLPYPPGEGHLIVQGNCSAGPTHLAGSVFKYGYDFEMPVGTPIHAARRGVVLGVEQRFADFNGPGGAPNYVWVRHDDGSVGRYWHGTRNGARVEVGQAVQAGDLLALSGATGLTELPHLHFDVAECGPAATCHTLPVTFRNTSPHPNGLQYLQRYVARPH